jgi:hypothetical protein
MACASAYNIPGKTATRPNSGRFERRLRHFLHDLGFDETVAAGGDATILLTDSCSARRCR